MKKHILLIFIIFTLVSCISNPDEEIEELIETTRTLIKNGNTKRAVYELEQALNDKPNNNRILYELFFVNQEHINDFEKANKYLVQYCDIVNSSNCHTLLGFNYNDLNNVDSAFTSFEKSIKLDSLNPIPYLELGVIYKKHFKKTELALSYYLKAYELNLIKEYPENQLSEYNNDFSTMLYNIGNTYYALEQYEKSNEFLLKSLEYDSNMAIILNSIANNFMRLEKYKKALHYYNKALKTDSTFIYSVNGKGNALLAIGDTNEACRYWNLAQTMGYSYQEKWFKEYAIIDPKKLIKEYCK